VDDISDPGSLPQRSAQALHVRLKPGVGDEESLHTLREFLLEKRGGCTLFLHVGDGNGGGESVVQASSQIRVSGSEQVLDALREYPEVADAWTE